MSDQDFPDVYYARTHNTNGQECPMDDSSCIAKFPSEVVLNGKTYNKREKQVEAKLTLTPETKQILEKVSGNVDHYQELDKVFKMMKTNLINNLKSNGIDLPQATIDDMKTLDDIEAYKQLVKNSEKVVHSPSGSVPVDSQSNFSSQDDNGYESVESMMADIKAKSQSDDPQVAKKYNDYLNQFWRNTSRAMKKADSPLLREPLTYPSNEMLEAGITLKKFLTETDLGLQKQKRRLTERARSR